MSRDGKGPGWAAALRTVSTMQSRFKRASDKAMLEEAHFYRGKIVDGISSGAPAGQAFAPLSPLTLAARKAEGFAGTKPLIERGDLRNGVSVKRTPGGIFVGILKTAKAKGGGSLANIAELHEFGGPTVAQPMTEKQRRFLFALLREAGTPPTGDGVGVIVSRIPARPFIRPILERYANGAEAAKRFANRVVKHLGGGLGRG